MIAVDTNVLVHTYRTVSPRHAAAVRRLNALAGSARIWGVPVFCLGEFIRVITHRRFFGPPHTALDASSALAELLSLDNVTVLMPSDDFPRLLADTIRESGAVGNLVFDAQIAALCVDRGVTALVTEDRDFDRFRNLQTERL